MPLAFLTGGLEHLGHVAAAPAQGDSQLGQQRSEAGDRRLGSWHAAAGRSGNEGAQATPPR